MTLGPSVCIVGAGPAGLLAAWGAMSSGAAVTILDRDPSYRADRIFSLQYMHESCGLDFAVRRINLHYDWVHERVNSRLSRDELRTVARLAYNRKLGRPDQEDNSTRFIWSSPSTVWSLKDAYKHLHGAFRWQMFAQEAPWSRIVGELAGKYDIVINTAPLDKLIPEWSWPVRMGLIAFHWSPIRDQQPETCVYNFEPEVAWYRATRLDGGTATEYAKDDGSCPVQLSSLRKVTQAAVLPHLPANVTLAGRWGSWDPKALTHHAYRIAQRLVEEAKG